MANKRGRKANSKRLKLHARVLLVSIGVLAGTFALGFLGARGGISETSGSTIEQEVARCQAVAQEGRDAVRCVEDSLRRFAKERDISEAQALAKAFYQRGVIPLDACHNMAHLVGELMEGRHGFDAAVESADDFCNWGYLHGVFEGIHREYGWSREELARKGGNLCYGLGENSREETVNCFHGLGHSLTDFDPYDLVGALNACDAAGKGADERRECYGGVFMQIARPDAGSDNKAPFYDPDDPFYPCDLLSGDHRRSCLYEVSQRAIHAGTPFAEVAPLCGQINHIPTQKVCVSQIFGSIAYGPYSMEEKRLYCRSFSKDYTLECFKGVAEFIANNPSDFGTDGVNDFCEDITKEEQTVCRNTE